MTIERRWLKAKEVAEYLGIHEKSVYRACCERKIPFCKAQGVGLRIDRHELDALLERKGIPPEEFRKLLKSRK